MRVIRHKGEPIRICQLSEEEGSSYMQKGNEGIVSRLSYATYVSYGWLSDSPLYLEELV